MRCLKTRHDGAGGRFIVANLGDLACALAGRLTQSEVARIVGVGDSGTDFARRIRQSAPWIDVVTVRFDRDRARRELAVGTLPRILGGLAILIDDAAVSGRTLQVVRDALNRDVETAGVGLLFDSTRSRRRTGISDIRFGLLYCREGGGSPPINSLATLRTMPDRLDELAGRYFGGSEAFKQTIRGDNL